MSQTPATSRVPPSGASADDPWLRRGRELVAALLALIIVIGAAILIANAFKFVGVDDTKDHSFQHAKDLLNIILPLLGVVLGYYFTKVSTESRAESAEKTAQTATTTAQQATEARQLVESENREVKGSLKEISDAAERLLGAESATLDVLGASATDNSSYVQPRSELRAALDRAKRYLR